MNDTAPLIDSPAQSPEATNDLIRTLYLNANNDILSLIAGTMNLYAQSKQRLLGNVRFTPEDAKRILDMVMVLLDVPNAAQDFTGAKAPAKDLKL